ncbi:uncharacterized protein ACBT57_008124 [Dama dama]
MGGLCGLKGDVGSPAPLTALGRLSSLGVTTPPNPPRLDPGSGRPATSDGYCPARAGCQELSGGARCLARRAREKATGLGRQGSGIRGCPEPCLDGGGGGGLQSPHVDSSPKLATDWVA